MTSVLFIAAALLTGDAAVTPVSADEVIVTAEKRPEPAQATPLAVSVLGRETLQRDRIESGLDLQLEVPNLTASRASFGEANFQIRGVGYQLISTSGDAGVGVHENQVPLTVNRLADADFYDLERIEVLRGPQGTLFGRNATGGVIDLVTAQPTGRSAASLTVDAGGYGTRRVQGYVDAPVSDTFAVRAAADYLHRDGYQQNLTVGGPIDGRDLYSTRVTASWRPTAQVHATALWEHFGEADDRTGGAYTFCTKDPGPASVGGVPVTVPTARLLLSRGCLPSSVSDSSARGVLNSVATLSGLLSLLAGLQRGDAYADAAQPADLRDTNLTAQPFYKDHADIAQLNMAWDLAPNLSLVSLTGYSEDHLRFYLPTPVPPGSSPFTTTRATPGGVFPDPQVGVTPFLAAFNYQDNRSQQWSEELRLQSSFAGPVNFSAGAIYLHLRRFNDLFIGANGYTAYSELTAPGAANPIHVDSNFPPDGTGHNYYLSRTPYDLGSTAEFGELYVDLPLALQLTLGVRHTEDDKRQVVYPVELTAPGAGFPASLVTQKASFDETTGRVNLAWSPHTAFTDRTLVYASYSRGYKGGGFNAPDLVSTTPTYAPELVDAIEVGTKNTLLHRRMTLNLTGFFYDYRGYQISQILGLTASTVNVDAHVAGAELETAWEPVSDLRLDLRSGYLDTAIEDGASIDPFNRTQGDPALTLLKSATSACVGPTRGAAALVAAIDAGRLPPNVLLGACPTAAAPDGAFATALAGLGVVLPTRAGVPVPLRGKDLPNAPHWTVSAGIQKRVVLLSGWSATGRVEGAYQTAAFARYYNDASDRLPGYGVVNATLTLAQPRLGLSVQGYCRNLGDVTAVTGLIVGSDSSGLKRSAFLTDPRVAGVALTKTF